MFLVVIQNKNNNNSKIVKYAFAKKIRNKLELVVLHKLRKRMIFFYCDVKKESSEEKKTKNAKKY